MSDHQIKAWIRPQNIMLLGLVGLCLALGGYNFHARQAMSTTIQALKMQSENQNSRWGDLIDAQQTLHEQQVAQDKLMASLKKTWLSVSADEYDIWMIRESAALITQAEHYDSILKDRKTAMLLLSLAQKRLEVISDELSLTVPLKQQLKQVLLTLKVNQPVDQQQVWQTFEALTAALSHLPWPKSLTADPEQDSEVLPEASFQALWHEVKDLVRIRAQSTDTLMPLIQDSEQRHWTYGLTLLIEQARWAWVQKDKATYQMALQVLSDRMEAVFSRQLSEMVPIFQKIETLQSFDTAYSAVDWTGLLTVTQQVENISNARA